MNSVISFKLHVKWRKETMKLMRVQKGRMFLMFAVERQIGRL